MASKKMIRKMDKIFGAYIRSLGKCERCGKTKENCQLQWCHIHSRRKMSTRWAELNSLCLCVGCHRWGHDHPTDFTQWLNEYLGSEIVEELRRENNRTKKWLDWELEEMIEKYKNQERTV